MYAELICTASTILRGGKFSVTELAEHEAIKPVLLKLVQASESEACYQILREVLRNFFKIFSTSFRMKGDIVELIDDVNHTSTQLTSQGMLCVTDGYEHGYSMDQCLPKYMGYGMDNGGSYYMNGMVQDTEKKRLFSDDYENMSQIGNVYPYVNQYGYHEYGSENDTSCIPSAPPSHSCRRAAVPIQLNLFNSSQPPQYPAPSASVSTSELNSGIMQSARSQVTANSHRTEPCSVKTPRTVTSHMTRTGLSGSERTPRRDLSSRTSCELYSRSPWSSEEERGTKSSRSYHEVPYLPMQEAIRYQPLHTIHPFEPMSFYHGDLSAENFYDECAYAMPEKLSNLVTPDCDTTPSSGDPVRIHLSVDFCQDEDEFPHLIKSFSEEFFGDGPTEAASVLNVSYKDMYEVSPTSQELSKENYSPSAVKATKNNTVKTGKNVVPAKSRAISNPTNATSTSMSSDTLNLSISELTRVDENEIKSSQKKDPDVKTDRKSKNNDVFFRKKKNQKGYDYKYYSYDKNYWNQEGYGKIRAVGTTKKQHTGHHNHGPYPHFVSCWNNQFSKHLNHRFKACFDVGRRVINYSQDYKESSAHGNGKWVDKNK